MNESIKKALTQNSTSTLDYANKSLKELEKLKKEYQEEVTKLGRRLEHENESLETCINGMQEDMEQEGWKDEEIVYQLQCVYDREQDETIYPLEYDYKIAKKELKAVEDLIEIFTYYSANNKEM